MDGHVGDAAGKRAGDPAEIHSFLLMSNILDLASASGNLAGTLRDAGVPECRPMAQADMFVSAVKALRGWRDRDRGERGPGHENGYASGMMSPEEWRVRHAQALEIARHLQVALLELPGADCGEAMEHLGRLDRKIADGRRLAA